MKVKTLIIVAFANFLFAISSCKKVYDYVEQHPTATSDACRIAQFVLSVSNVKLNYNVSYDKKGNMLSIVAEEGAPLYMNFDKYYRYDKHNQLTDYILAYHGYPIAIQWHSYQYAHNKIFDSLYANNGNIAGPTPPVNAPSDKKFFYEFTTDKDGRIVGYKSSLNQVGTWQYNDEGNLMGDPLLSYDKKINPYRTNKVWQQIFCDYSANNPIGYWAPPAYSYPKIVSYNSYGLPTKYIAQDGFRYSGGRFGFGLDSLEIKYDCDISNIAY